LRISLPWSTPTPVKGSFEIRRLPSRSAQSTIGLRCAAAEIATELSIIQPSMIFIPIARATWIMRIASWMPPDFMSLMLMPS